MEQMNNKNKIKNNSKEIKTKNFNEFDIDHIYNVINTFSSKDLKFQKEFACNRINEEVEKFKIIVKSISYLCPTLEINLKLRVDIKELK